MSNKIPITVEGYQRLKEELHTLKTKERPAIIDAISQARAHGDLKENAEYASAKERQSLNEGKIARLESLFSTAHVIDIAKLPQDGRVIFGCTVSLLNVDTDEHSQFKLVSEYEADLKQRKISITSPIARAMIGKREGDSFNFVAPTGTVEYEITKVEYV